MSTLGLVSLSAGGRMMGAAFLNLLPEAACKNWGAEATLGWVLGSFSGFYFGKTLHWHLYHNQIPNDYMLSYRPVAGLPAT